ncbi:MAG: TIGR02757 family protein [Candidatus Krumholzibacteria bacterium]|nr:TIGR02757 family protein [Candidatus Krumholzibacteria bacterium]
MNGPNLKKALDNLYERYDRREYLDPDPLVFLYDYPDVLDREIVGLISSSLAFGGVRQIMASVEKVLEPMGRSPRDFVTNTSQGRMSKLFEGFKHRWATSEDLVQMLTGVRSMIKGHGSLEKGFTAGMRDDDVDVIPAMTRFASEIVCVGSGAGVCLIPDPCRKSACKRLNLFLRWMVRSDNVDPGGWDGVPAGKLIIPLDTHMYRFASLLGMTGRKQANLATAREITAQFAEISPDDPVKYDFALTRLGIRRDDDRGELMARLGIKAAAK